MVKEIPLTQGQVAIVDDFTTPCGINIFEEVNKYKWYAHKKGSGKNTRWYARHGRHNPLMHRFIIRLCPLIKLEKSDSVDHINFNGLDNRLDNLRIVTNRMQQQHARKQQQRKGGEPSSEYKGVSWHSKDRKWIAQIMVDGIQYKLGAFDDEIEAAELYDINAYFHFKEYAALNFPESEIIQNMKQLESKKS